MALSNTNPQTDTSRTSTGPSASPENAPKKQPWGEGAPPWENPNHNGQSPERHEDWKEMVKLHGLEKTIRSYHLIEGQMDLMGT